MEARVGIEPTHRAFAEPGLTSWLPRLDQGSLTVINKVDRGNTFDAENETV